MKIRIEVIDENKNIYDYYIDIDNDFSKSEQLEPFLISWLREQTEKIIEKIE